MHRKLLNIIITLLTAILTIASGSPSTAQESDSTQFVRLIKQCGDTIDAAPYVAIEYAAQARQIAEASGDSTIATF